MKLLQFSAGDSHQNPSSNWISVFHGFSFGSIRGELNSLGTGGSGVGTAGTSGDW